MPWVRAWSVDDVAKHVDTLPLARKNAHARDHNVAFRDADHVYFVKGPNGTWLQLRTSVSGLYSRFFGNFDAEGASASVVRKRGRDRSSPYYWLIQACADPQDEAALAARVREAWALAGERASALGTRCHALMERFANAVEPLAPAAAEAVDLDGDAVGEARVLAQAAKAWLLARLEEGWRPHRTEWSIYMDGASADAARDGDLLEHHADVVAGQTDLLLRHEEHGFWLVDYKFCGRRKLDRDAGGYRGVVPRGLAPLHEVPDNSYGHYLAQQSMYAFILRHRYEVEVKRSSLLHVPTDELPVQPRLVDLELLPDATVRAMFSPPRARSPRERSGDGFA